MSKSEKAKWAAKCIRDAEAAERMAKVCPSEKMREFHLKFARCARAEAAKLAV